jgi:hypothetical protein
MVDIVEQSFDVKLDHPVILPTAPPDQSNRVMRRAPGPVPIGVPMKHRLQVRLKHPLHDGLCHSVGDGRDTEQAYPTRLLRNRNPFDRRWKITAGTKPIPKLVKVVAQSLFEDFDGFPVDPG